MPPSHHLGVSIHPIHFLQRTRFASLIDTSTFCSHDVQVIPGSDDFRSCHLPLCFLFDGPLCGRQPLLRRGEDRTATFANTKFSNEFLWVFAIFLLVLWPFIQPTVSQASSSCLEESDSESSLLGYLSFSLPC